LKASKFTDAQKAFILKQDADGHPVAEIYRTAGISEATYFRHEGLLPYKTRRLKRLEDENAKLKKLVPDISLDKAILQKVLRRKLLGLSVSASW
jgi:putative transposase